MGRLMIGRCAFESELIKNGIPFWFEGVCVGKLSATDDLEVKVLLNIGSEVDDKTYFAIRDAVVQSKKNDVFDYGDNMVKLKSDDKK